MSELVNKLKNRRSYRIFSKDEIDINQIIDAIEAAKYSPSGANKQPWTFCIVQSFDVKRKIRNAAEKIEQEFYSKISSEWKDDLSDLKVNTSKPFLEEAPFLIVIFKHKYQLDNLGNKQAVYYPDISVGIATGILISALTDLGIDILTYTPAPNHFLKEILNRPVNETPFLILVCGKGSKDYKLPDITKKSNEEVIFIY